MRHKLALGSLWVCLGALGLPAQNERVQEKSKKRPAWHTDAVHAALVKANRDQKRVLILAAPSSGRKALRKTLSSRAMGRLVRYEYEVVALEKPELIHGKNAPARATLTVIGPAQELTTIDWTPTTKVTDIKTFLTKHQAPRLDAEAVFAAALADAKRTNRRILVHLGAPW